MKSGQIFCFQEIPIDFQIVFLEKISGNFFQESVQLAAPKNLDRNFLVFQKKFVGFKNFWFPRKMLLFARKIFRPENLCL